MTRLRALQVNHSGDSPGNLWRVISLSPRLLGLTGPCLEGRGTVTGSTRKTSGFPPRGEKHREGLDGDLAESKRLKGIIKETANCK